MLIGLTNAASVSLNTFSPPEQAVLRHAIGLIDRDKLSPPSEWQPRRHPSKHDIWILKPTQFAYMTVLFHGQDATVLDIVPVSKLGIIGRSA